MTRIWVEIIRGRRKGARGWHTGTKIHSGRFVVSLPGLEYPRDAIIKHQRDLRLLSEVEMMAEQFKGVAA